MHCVLLFILYIGVIYAMYVVFRSTYCVDMLQIRRGADGGRRFGGERNSNFQGPVRWTLEKVTYMDIYIYIWML